MKNELQKRLPADFYEKYNISYEDYGSIGLAMNVRSNDQTVGMCANPKVWESFIPSIEFDIEEQKVKSVILHPITLHFEAPRSRRGWPSLTNNNGMAQEIDAISRSYGTTIRTISDTEYVVD